MNTRELYEKVSAGDADGLLLKIYGKDHLEARRKRALDAISSFEALYGNRDGAALFSVPGRSELSGNHTDHNCGKVIAASIDLDILAVAAPTGDNVILFHSEGFPEDRVDIALWKEPDPGKFGTSASLIAGMCRAFSDRGLKVGGFCAYATSNVLKGSGLSSSAAYENSIGNILNHFYNGGKVDNIEIAKMSQWDENVFFGKPCGLMDQVACAVGGAVAIDFADPAKPVVDTMQMNLGDYKLCIVNTGGNHADLTGDYAAVPAEMKSVAAHFGKKVLRQVSREQVLADVALLREEVGDRAVLRALHFFDENDRVEKQKDALLREDLKGFFALVKESGRSSYCYLQNVYTNQNVREQGLSLALCAAERLLSSPAVDGAWRVHGGGFAGTIQCYVPSSAVPTFEKTMNGMFGEGACIVLSIRPLGAIRIL